MLHLYQLGNDFSFDSNPKALSNLFIKNPVLLLLCPSDTPEHCSIVRFAAFVAFNIPSVTAVLARETPNTLPTSLTSPALGIKPSPTYASCGVSNILPSLLNTDLVDSLLTQSQSFATDMIQRARHSPDTSPLTPVSNVPTHTSTLPQNDKHLITFQKSQQHIHYYISALEHFHQKNISPEYKALFDSTTNSPDTSTCSAYFDPNSYPSVFNLSSSQVNTVLELIGSWDFYAHDLTYSQLLFAAFSMIKHGLSAPQVADLRLDETGILQFLLVVKDSYRPSNPYHNFRHAVDVLQATFYFLLKLHALPPYPASGPSDNDWPTDSENILSPVEALTILIVAIGHDVGHPGVTNLFLVKSHTPIANVFNDKSVLESFHSAAFTEILKRYWPTAQALPICKLIVKSVLATDMALHFDYMEEVSSIIDSPLANSSFASGTLSYQTLICCLLIKCADISNVARKLDISTEWGVVLGKEFAQVEELEISLGLKSPPPPPSPTPQVSGKEDLGNDQGPATENLVKLAKGQIFFINTFAKPLFSAVSKLLPQLRYTLTILEENAATWTAKLDES